MQLDYPSDGHWNYADIFAVEVRFQIRDQFWVLQLKIHWTKYLIFLAKPQNGLVTLVFAKRCFTGFFEEQIWPFELKSIF